MFGVVLVVAVAGGIWLLGFRNTTTPVSPDDVISSLTSATSTTTPASTATSLEPDTTVVPPAGAEAYVYTTTGYEQVDALGGARHDYPAETYVSRRPGGCGTIFRWDALAERFAESEICDGRLASERSFHRWFGQDDDELSECDGDNYWVPPDDTVISWSYTCTSPQSSSEYAVELQGIETLTIGGRSIDTYHLTVTSTTGNGRTTGTKTSDVWRALDGGLPVREAWIDDSTTESPIGPINYEERVDVRVASLEPLS